MSYIQPLDELISYADHTHSCKVCETGDHDDCDCGYNDAEGNARAAWDALKMMPGSKALFANAARKAAADYREIEERLRKRHLLGDCVLAADARALVRASRPRRSRLRPRSATFACAVARIQPKSTGRRWQRLRRCGRMPFGIGGYAAFQRMPITRSRTR